MKRSKNHKQQKVAQAVQPVQPELNFTEQGKGKCASALRWMSGKLQAAAAKLEGSKVVTVVKQTVKKAYAKSYNWVSLKSQEVWKWVTQATYQVAGVLFALAAIGTLGFVGTTSLVVVSLLTLVLALALSAAYCFGKSVQLDEPGVKIGPYGVRGNGSVEVTA